MDDTGDSVGGVLVESFLGEKGLHGSNTGGERSDEEELEVLCFIFELQSNFNRFSLTSWSLSLLSLTTFLGRPGPRFTLPEDGGKLEFETSRLTILLPEYGVEYLVLLNFD